MAFQIIRNDITKVHADAIVNTANPEPVFGNGTDRAVYMAAGVDELLSERKKIGRIRPGNAAVTPAFRLPAKYIIHTVGPIWQGGERGEAETLASCYRNSLRLASENDCESVAFPLISAGTYGFPRDLALDVALKTIREFLEDHEMDVTLVVFNRKAFELSSELVENVRQYIDDHYVEEKHMVEHGNWLEAPTGGLEAPTDRLEAPRGFFRRRRKLYHKSEDAQSDAAYLEERRLEEQRRKESYREERRIEADYDEDAFEEEIYPEELSRDEVFGSYALPSSARSEEPPSFPSAAASGPAPRPSETPPAFSSIFASSGPAPRPSNQPQSLSEMMAQLGENFQERLLGLIDERGLKDSEVYRKANIDRKLFSKIRCNPLYLPKKRTALALAIALRLDLEETEDLLSRAGHALSPGSRADLIVKYCIEHQIYDIFEINALLFEYDQPLLGT